MELVHLLKTHYGLNFAEYVKHYKCKEHDGLIVFKDTNKAFDFSLNFTKLYNLNQIFDARDIIKLQEYSSTNIGELANSYKYLHKVTKNKQQKTQSKYPKKPQKLPKWLKKDVGFNACIVSFMQKKIGGNYLDSTIINPILDKYIVATFKPCKDGYIRLQYKTPKHCIKLKSINAEKENKYYQKGSFKDYIFGDFNNNSDDDIVFLCGGEDDTLAMLAHGFNAVCGYSEIANIDHIISEAKKLNKRIICAYDNDDTGKEQARKIKEQYKIQTFNFGIYRDYVNDICDLVDFLANNYLATAKQRFIYLVKYNTLELRTLDHHPPTAKIRTSYPIQTKQISVKQYASEAIEEIKSFIHYTGQYKALNAPAGTGKTYAIQNLMNDDFLKIIGCKKVVFAVPTTTIAAQTKKDIDKYLKINTPILSSDDKNTFEDKQNAKDAKFVVSVYDSTTERKINDLQDAFLIIDEAHFLISEQYRLNALVMLQGKAKQCRKVLFLSATHNLNYLRLMRVDVLTINPKRKNKLRLHVLTYSDSNKADIVHYAEIISKKYDSTMFVLNDKNYLKSSHFRDNVISAEDKQSERYKQLVNNGIAPEKFGCTELLKAGASIKSEVQSIILSNVKDTSDIIQFCNRPRMQPNGINSVIDVYLIVKIEKTPHKPNLGVLWQLLRDSNNELKIYTNTPEDAKSEIEDSSLFLADERNQKIKLINTLAYFESMIKLSVKELIDTIIKIDDRFELVSVDSIENGSTEAQQIKADAKELQERKKASFEKVKELAANDANFANMFLLASCTDKSQKDKLIKCDHLNPTSICTFQADANIQAFKNKNAELFEHSREIQERLNIALDMTKLNIDKSDLCRDILTSTQTELNRKKELLRYKNTGRRYKAKDNTLSEQKAVLYEATTQAIKAIKGYKMNKRKLSKERLEQIITKDIKRYCKKKGFTSFTGYKKGDVSNILYTFFDAECIRERKGKNWKVSYIITKNKVTGL